MAKHKTKPKQTYRCQYCSTSYRHKSMADKCLKTKICRLYNAPSAERRNALTIQVGVAAVAQFVLALLIKKNGDVAGKAKAVESLFDVLFPEFHKLQCNMRFFEETAGKVADVLLELWPADVETNAIHMLSVSGALIIEMRQELKPFWESRPDLKAPVIWQEVEDGLDKIFEYFNADLSEDYIYSDRVPDAVEKLQKVIWPEVSATPTKLFLYLVNDNYWVVATSRTHTKQIALKEQRKGRSNLIIGNFRRREKWRKCIGND